jgi:peptidoglycan L-alanyl-D-glutamate endopeptidase CwlK
MGILISKDKSLLYPPFADQLADFESRLAAEKLAFYLFMGLRTFEDQDELYAKGRTKPGKIVTNAWGGDSPHNYGLACDFVLDAMPEKPGIRWRWDTRADFNSDGRSGWMQMGEAAESCGLEWGGRWKHFPDLPHLQNTYGLTPADIKDIYRAGHGIKAVWAGLRVA